MLLRCLNGQLIPCEISYSGGKKTTCIFHQPLALQRLAPRSCEATLYADGKAASLALAGGAACAPLLCNHVKARQRAGREQALWLGPCLPGLGEESPAFTGTITLPGLLGRERRGSGIFTHTIAKRPVLPTCLFVC